MTTTTRTKAEELAAVRALAEQLGPTSYLGPWLADALPWLEDQLRCDYIPQRARAMAEEAARIRAEAACDAVAMRQAPSWRPAGCWRASAKRPTRSPGRPRRARKPPEAAPGMRSGSP